MSAPASQLAVRADPVGDAALVARAERLAAALGVPLAEPRDPGKGADLLLVVTPERLEIRATRGPLAGGRGVFADLAALDTTSGPGRSLQQPLYKAVGIHKGAPYRPHVIDATVGFGEDAWLLASVGCRVEAVERGPVVAALLADALERAAAVRGDVAARITLHTGDSLAFLGDVAARPVASRPEVVYLDPMFPTGRKAAERKPMRMLRELVGADVDADELLIAALAAARRRVVVKRPAKAPTLAGREPTTVHRGQAVRFDVYVPPPPGSAPAPGSSIPACGTQLLAPNAA